MIRLCEICGSEAEYTCSMCGRRVCSRHYDRGKGLCAYCSSTLCQLCGERLAIAACPVCGRVVCDKCSVQLTPVVRLCRDCYTRLGASNWPPSALLAREQSVINTLKQLTLKVLRS